MTAEVYDLIYDFKDYDSEAEKIKEIIASRLKSGGKDMLDIACGTGKHMEFLRQTYDIDGIDLSTAQVASAKQKFPEARIEQGDMTNFEMNKQYDVIVCLFSSIGYVKSKENLDRTVSNISRHLKPGGIAIIEPWISPEVFQEGRISMETNDKREDIKVSRIIKTSRQGNLSILDAHIMVGRPDGVEHFEERHEMAMFTDQEFEDSFDKSGLSTEIDPDGLIGRRLVIGTKPV